MEEALAICSVLFESQALFLQPVGSIFNSAYFSDLHDIFLAQVEFVQDWTSNKITTRKR